MRGRVTSLQPRLAVRWIALPLAPQNLPGPIGHPCASGGLEAIHHVGESRFLMPVQAFPRGSFPKTAPPVAP